MLPPPDPRICAHIFPTHSQFQSGDVSVQATLEYAVTVLGVQHGTEHPYLNDTIQYLLLNLYIILAVSDSF